MVLSVHFYFIPDLFFFFLFFVFFRIFDNVIAIRFMLSLVKYHNCFVTILVLKEKTGKTIDTNTTYSQDMLIHPYFYVKLHAPLKSTIPH